jgi:hypothetical protein
MYTKYTHIHAGSVLHVIAAVTMTSSFCFQALQSQKVLSECDRLLSVQVLVFEFCLLDILNFLPFRHNSRVTGRRAQCTDAVCMLEEVICCDMAH